MGQGQDPKVRRRPLEIRSKTTDLMSPDNPEIILKEAALARPCCTDWPRLREGVGVGWGGWRLHQLGRGQETGRLPLTP